MKATIFIAGPVVLARQRAYYIWIQYFSGRYFWWYFSKKPSMMPSTLWKKALSPGPCFRCTFMDKKWRLWQPRSCPWKIWCSPDCLPGSLAPKMAALAKQCSCHYANLTEYVSETNQIKSIAEDADTAFVLQTGLAPVYQCTGLCCTNSSAKIRQRHAGGNDHESGAKMLATRIIMRFTWVPLVVVATEYLKCRHCWQLQQNRSSCTEWYRVIDHQWRPFWRQL